MVRLDCNVKNCIHNADNCCCRGSILVEGPEALKKESTCCASFDQKKDNNCRNKYQTPDTSLAVDCEATHCRYNENRMCKAAHINISGSTASEVRQTQCSTFEAR